MADVDELDRRADAEREEDFRDQAELERLLRADGLEHATPGSCLAAWSEDLEPLRQTYEDGDERAEMLLYLAGETLNRRWKEVSPDGRERLQ